MLFSIFAVLAPSVGAAGAADFNPPGKGPWRAQIVDAETKQPLEGVVVLAVWNERYGSVGGLAGGGYFASEEVVSGVDGRFAIPALKKRLFNPVAVVQGPEFYIFKPGYGRWHFLGEEGWRDLWWEERNKRYEEAWRQFNSEDGVVLEMPPLKTRRERLNSMGDATPSPEIPASHVRRMLEAIDRERVFLGLRPLHLHLEKEK